MKSKLDEDKLRGGYYTPNTITEFISKWAISKKTKSVLEPSSGDGAFISSIIERFSSLGISVESLGDLINSVELIEKEAMKVKEIFVKYNIPLSKKTVTISDFFHEYNSNLKFIKFDAIVGNPPFIRYQNFPSEFSEIATKLLNELGIKTNKLTNVWLYFLVLSVNLLSKNGRIGMVIPAELFQVKYAETCREYLTSNLKNITIITFKELVFKGIQQEVVLILGEKSDGKTNNNKIRIIEVDKIEDLNNVQLKENNNFKPILHYKDKWTYYYLEDNEIEFLHKIRKSPKFKILKNYIEVDVGVVTGENSFFVIDAEKCNQFNLNESVIDIVTRTKQLKGLEINSIDWADIAKNDKAFLFYPDPKIQSLTQFQKNYIKYGEDNGLNLGYKCRIRKKWYQVPSVHRSDGFMMRQIHNFPKILVNRLKSTCTDTIHRVKLINDIISLEQISIALMNSLSFSFGETLGRSYGGGVLTFEPSESEEIPLFIDENIQLDFKKIDSMIRNGDIDGVLDYTDQKILKEYLGLSPDEILLSRQIWIKLRDRRINRKSRINRDYK